MRAKHASKAAKRHRKTFHLARHNPALWQQVRESNLLESLHEDEERARALEMSEKSLEDTQKRASIYILSSVRIVCRLMGRPKKQD